MEAPAEAVGIADGVSVSVNEVPSAEIAADIAPDLGDLPDPADLDMQLETMRQTLEAMEDEEFKNVGGGSRADRDEADLRSIYLGNVDYSAKAQDLANIFNVCGQIKRVTILCHPNGQPKGYAYLECDSQETANRCVAMCESNPPVLNGRQLKAAPKRKNIHGHNVPPARGGRGGRGGRMPRMPYGMPPMGFFPPPYGMFPGFQPMMPRGGRFGGRPFTRGRGRFGS